MQPNFSNPPNPNPIMASCFSSENCLIIFMNFVVERHDLGMVTYMNIIFAHGKAHAGTIKNT